MNLNKIRLKSETKDLLLSLTKNCETFIEKTHREAEETLEFELNKPRETFLFNPPIAIEGSWSLVLCSLEGYKSVFNVITTKIRFELYTNNFDKFSFEELKDELMEILTTSDITPYHLQHEKIGPRIIEAYKKVILEKSSTDGYIILLMGYARSPFRDFESYPTIVVVLDEDDIELVSKQYKSIFVKYEIVPGVCSIKDIADAVYTMGDRERTLQIEHDDIIMKTKFNSFRFGATFVTLQFDKRSLFNTLLGFTPYWDYKTTNAIHAYSPGVYTSEKLLFLSTIDKLLLKCDVIDGSLVNGLRQRTLFSFVLAKPNGYKVLREPETVYYKKINKFFLNKLTFYLEDDNHEEGNSYQKTLTFKLQMTKILN